MLCHGDRLLFIFVYSAGLSALFTGSGIHMDQLWMQTVIMFLSSQNGSVKPEQITSDCGWLGVLAIPRWDAK